VSRPPSPTPPAWCTLWMSTKIRASPKRSGLGSERKRIWSRNCWAANLWRSCPSFSSNEVCHGGCSGTSFVTRHQYFFQKTFTHLKIYLHPCPVLDNQSACRVSGLCCTRSKWLCSIAHAQQVTAIINKVFHAKREKLRACTAREGGGKPYSHLAAQGLLGRVWCWRNRA